MLSVGTCYHTAGNQHLALLYAKNESEAHQLRFHQLFNALGYAVRGILPFKVFFNPLHYFLCKAFYDFLHKAGIPVCAITVFCGLS